MHTAPVEGGRVDIVTEDTKIVLLLLARLKQWRVNIEAVPSLMLLGDLIKYSDAFSLVKVCWIDRAIIFIVDECDDLVLPSVEDGSEPADMVYLSHAALKDNDAVLLIETVKQGIVLVRLLGFHSLLGKFLKSLDQLLLHLNAISFNNTFVFIDFDNGIELVDSLLRYVEVIDLVIADHCLIIFLSRLSISE